MKGMHWALPLAAWVLSPLMLGIINRVKAFFAGRRGPSVWQLYFDLFKLLRKGSVYSRSTSMVIRVAPSVILACLAISTTMLPWGGLERSRDICRRYHPAGLPAGPWPVSPRYWQP